MHDPLLSTYDDGDSGDFLDLTNQAWDPKTDPPLLVSLMSLPATILSIAWSFIRG